MIQAELNVKHSRIVECPGRRALVLDQVGDNLVAITPYKTNASDARIATFLHRLDQRSFLCHKCPIPNVNGCETNSKELFETYQSHFPHNNEINTDIFDRLQITPANEVLFSALLTEEGLALLTTLCQEEEIPDMPPTPPAPVPEPVIQTPLLPLEPLYPPRLPAPKMTRQEFSAWFKQKKKELENEPQDLDSKSMSEIAQRLADRGVVLKF